MPSLVILVSVLLVLSCGQTDRDAAKRLSRVIVAGVSKYFTL